MIWTWLPSAVNSPPAAGKLGVNKNNPAVASVLWFSPLDKGGVNRSAIIAQLQEGDRIQLNQTTDSTVWIRYTLTADPLTNSLAVALDAVENFPTKPTQGFDVDAFLYADAEPEQPPVEPPDYIFQPTDLLLNSPYELTHELVVGLGVGQNPTADVYVLDSFDPFNRGRRAQGKKVTGDGPRAKERIAPVDPRIG